MQVIDQKKKKYIQITDHKMQVIWKSIRRTQVMR